MKDRWKFCQCCYLNGHCENQDRDMKCEHYSKQLEDKVERLQEQIREANEIIKESSKRIKFAGVCFTSIPHQFKVKDKLFNQIEDYFKKYDISWGVK